ncbi:MAG: TIGR02444 family protein [Alphaproteobacteria bacterium]
MADAAVNPFWRFSLMLYGRDGVAPACLRLQDRHGLDVNIILYCCWAAGQGVALEAAAITAITDGTKAWRREVIRPLRAVRRALRGGIAPVAAPAGDALRKDVQRLELDSERLLQDAMWQTFPIPAPVGGRDIGGLAQANLECYARVSNVASAGADLGIVAGALSGVSPS